MMEKTPKTTWIIPPVTVQLPDGSTLVKPGKAIQRATITRCCVLSGIERRTLHALADAGLLTRERPTPSQAFFYPGEIEEFLRKTADDPDFWNSVRKRAFLTGKDLRSSRPK